jgi:hypothetical protein
MQDLNSQTGIPGDFFTPASLGTLAGATGAVYIICSTIQTVFNFNPKWLALLVSILISYLGAYVTLSNDDQVTKYFVALLNGFLIYAAATGTNQVVGKKAPEEPHQAGFRHTIVSKRKFSTKWW